VCLCEVEEITGHNYASKCARGRPKLSIVVPTTNGDGDGRQGPPILSPTRLDPSFRPTGGVCWRGVVLDDDFEVLDNSPLSFFPHCCDQILGLLELRLLGSGEVSIKEDLVWEGIQLSLSLEGSKSIP